MKIKPQSPGTPIRWSHPLATGLVRAWIFNGRRGRDSSGWTFRDAVAGDTATYTRNSADTLWTDGPAGPAFQAGADGGVASFSATQAISRWGPGLTTSSISVAARVLRFGSNPNLESIAGGGGGANVLQSRLASGNTDGFALCYDNNNSTWRFCADGSGQEVGCKSNTSASLNTWYTPVGTYTRDTSVATYGGYWRIYVDGQFKAVNNSNIAGSFAGTFTDRVPVFNGNGNFCSDKRYDYVYVWNRALSPQEVAWVTDQPFDVFAPRRAWSFAGEAATGGADNPNPPSVLRGGGIAEIAWPVWGQSFRF